MKIENVDSLIFDMDGTLWDAMKSYAEVWNVAFKEYGLDITVNEDVLKTGMGMNIGDIMEMLSKQYGFKISADTFIARVDEIEGELLPKIGGVLYPGVKAGLEHLSKKYRLFLLSNCGAQGLPNFMEFTGTKRYFTDYLSYGMREQSKADNLAYLCECHGLKNPVYVGDTQSDCNQAHKAGIPFVYASYGFDDCADYDMRIDSFSELEKYFL